MEQRAIRHWPEEERPREKLQKYGSAALSNAEILAILLGSGSEGTSAVALAEKILAMEEDGIRFLAHCQPEELCRVPGVGSAKAARILSAVELGRRISADASRQRTTVLGSEDVAAMVMEEMRYFRREVFRVVFLNVKNEVLGMEDIAVGGLNATYVQPREIFANAIRKGAASVVLIHNHPSGDPQPSEKDLELTRRAVEAGKLLGVRVADHIVIGNGVYHSIFWDIPWEERPS